MTGLLRTRQDRLQGIERNSFQPCPFDLDDLPQQIGNWKNDPTQVHPLDDKTVQITGSTNHLVRTYINDLTGVRLSLLLLYGPAEPVLPHTPEVCYPATGYGLDGAIGYAEVPYGDKFALFRTASYTRPGTLVSERARVYYSFRLNEKWSPDVGRGMKFHRSNPGLFKVQIQRGMGGGEKSDKHEPIESFLALLIPDLERRVEAGQETGSGTNNEKPALNPAGARAAVATSPGPESADPARKRMTGE